MNKENIIATRKAFIEAEKAGAKKRLLSTLLKDYRASYEEQGFEAGYLKGVECVFNADAKLIFDEDACEFTNY